MRRRARGFSAGRQERNVRLDAHSIGGACLVAGAALLIILTAAGSAARHPAARAYGPTGEFGPRRGALWLALHIATVVWLVLGLAALEWIVARRAGAGWHAVALSAVLYTLGAALLDGTARVVAGGDPERFRPLTLWPARVLHAAFWVPAVLVESVAHAVERAPSLRPRPHAADDEGLIQLMEREESEGGIEPAERAMIRAVFDLSDTAAREIMVPRIDMAALDTSASLQDVARLIAERGFSRIPLYEGTVDNIVGVVYAKDVLRSIARGEDHAAARAIARTPIYVPESKPLDELLQELRERRLQIAIVVDEYGGTAGLLTIEDLLEEIVGEIQDEYDQAEPNVERTEDGGAIVDARENVDILEDLFDVELEPDDFDTVGGLVIDALGRIPAAGETVRAYGLVFTVVSVAGRRVRRVRVGREAPVAHPQPVANQG